MSPSFRFAAVAFTIAVSIRANGAAVPGQPAADFQLTDVQGRSHRLADYRGKFVVLEWFNPGCPFVQKHYESGNMQRLQKRYTDKGAIWLAVNSTNPRSSDYRDPGRAQSVMRDWKMAPTALLRDEDGKVGQSLGAKATPHMFVIDPAGTVIYTGAIDDKATWRQEDVRTARNWVAAALDDAMSGKPVGTTSTSPYGCSVKY